MKICCISLSTREMQIKTTMEYQRYLLEWLKLEKLITLSIDIAMEQMQLSYFY